LKYNHVHGPGGSPVVYEDLLILNCDGGDVQFVVALDKTTGEIVWKTPRKHISQARRSGADRPGMGFSTPLLIEVVGKTQLVSTGGDHVAAYNPRSGEEIWWSAYNGYSLVPRPVFGHGLVYVCCGFPSPVLYAIRPGGSGEVTKSHVAWSDSRGVPLNPSPLLVGDELYMVSDNGVLKCLDAKTGDTHWQKRLEGNVWASPLFADGKIYILDKKGVCTVLVPGTDYRELAENRLEGRAQASIAAADGALFLRTDKALYRIENAKR
jgi:outer membrane protein assembly factor BamB